MQTYIVLAKLTEKGIQNIKDAPQRIERSAQDIKALGGNMAAFYTTMGEYDYVAVFEAPSDEIIMKFAMEVGMGGSVRTKTLRAFNRDEAAKIIKQLP